MFAPLAVHYGNRYEPPGEGVHWIISDAGLDEIIRRLASTFGDFDKLVDLSTDIDVLTSSNGRTRWIWRQPDDEVDEHDPIGAHAGQAAN